MNTLRSIKIWMTLVLVLGVATVAQAAGASLSQAVRVGVYLRDWDNFAEMNEIYVEFFGTENLPVRTTIPVPLKGIDIEIDAILYIGQ